MNPKTICKSRFILPLLILVATGAVMHAASFRFELAEGEHLDVFSGDRRVARYMIAHDPSTPERRVETYKPFLHIFDAAGVDPITKGAGGQYTHHRGIFYGFNKLTFDGKQYDRWHMKDGEQVHRAFENQKADAGGASFTSRIDWNDADGKAFLVEDRTFRFHAPPAGAYVLVEMESTLTAPRGDVELNGDPEHAGAQFRPADEVDRSAAVYVFPGEDTDPKTDHDLDWVGETFSLGGKRYSVVILNHPGNPDGSVFSAYRDYGRFGAFPKGAVSKDKPCNVRYRWLIAEGEMPSADAIQAAWNAFAGEEKAPPPVTVRAADVKKKKKKGAEAK